MTEMRRLLLAAMAIGWASRAAAESPRIVSGGPTKPAERDAVTASVRAAAATMAPCWRAFEGQVEVELLVDAAGRVVRATSRTKGAPGQCAAGLLAVAAMPKASSGWRAVVALPAAAPQTLEAAIQAQLSAHRARLAGCQSADFASKGQLALQLAIAADGRVTVASSNSSVSAAIGACVASAIAQLRLELPEAKAVRYQLRLDFAGGPAAPPSPGPSPSPTNPAAEISLKAGSALDGGQVIAALQAIQPVIAACSKKKAGEIVVGFTIRADGTTKNVAIKSSTLDAAVGTCVTSAVAKATFPAASGETRVNAPFVLSAK